jgi:uncharacterized membrane protein YfcA
MRSMNTVRGFRFLAWANVALGVLLGCVGLGACMRMGHPDTLPAWVLTIMAMLLVAISAGIVFCACRHLRRQNMRSALALAANTSVIIWLLCGMLAPPALRSMPSRLLIPMASLAVAFGCYCIVLRPLAQRAFKDNDTSQRE